MSSDIIKTLESEGYEKVEVKASELLEGDRVVVGDDCLHVKVSCGKPYVSLSQMGAHWIAEGLIDGCGCPVYRKKQQKPLVWEGRMFLSTAHTGNDYWMVNARNRIPKELEGKAVRITEISNEESSPSLPVWRGGVWVDAAGDLSPRDGGNFPREILNNQEIEIYLAGDKK